MNNIGSVIQSRRKELGISAANFAREVGVTVQAVWNWENRLGSSPARKYLTRIAEVLQLKVDHLLEPAQTPHKLEEHRLLKGFRLLNEQEQHLVLRVIEGLKRK